MKNAFTIILIFYFFLSLVSCSPKTNDSKTGTFFLREVNGKWDWYPQGNEDTEGKYTGEIRKGRPHGQGTYVKYDGPKSSTNQFSVMVPGIPRTIIFAITIAQLLNPGNQDQLSAKYEGGWKRGKKHGQGIYFFPNGDRYEGKWRRGKQSGEGSYFFPNGDRYVGEWENGQKHGEGTYFFSDGDYFKGRWENGKPHGEGKYTYPSGESFIGKWKEGKKHIQGPLILNK